MLSLMVNGVGHLLDDFHGADINDAKRCKLVGAGR
jgi:hypothetical protein